MPTFSRPYQYYSTTFKKIFLPEHRSSGNSIQHVLTLLTNLKRCLMTTLDLCWHTGMVLLKRKPPSNRKRKQRSGAFRLTRKKKQEAVFTPGSRRRCVYCLPELTRENSSTQYC